MSIDYLSIDRTWNLLLGPQEDPRYLKNTSGKAIRVIFSPTPVDVSSITEDSHYFTIGGSISTMMVPARNYIYAKANFKDNESDESGETGESGESGDIGESGESGETGETTKPYITITDYKPTSGSGGGGSSAPAEAEVSMQFVTDLMVQLMRLADRVTENSIALIHHAIDRELLRREFMDSELKTQEILASHQRQILLNVNRANTLEFYARNLRQAHDDLEEEVRKIKFDVQQDIDISELQHTVTVTTEKLESMDEDFNSISNALIKFKSPESSRDLDEEYEEYIKTIPAKMEEAVATIKALVAELNTATDTNTSQQDEIENKVGNADTVILDSDIEVLKQLEVKPILPEESTSN